MRELQGAPGSPFSWANLGIVRCDQKNSGPASRSSKNGTICSPGWEPWVPRPFNIPEPFPGRQSCVVPEGTLRLFITVTQHSRAGLQIVSSCGLGRVPRPGARSFLMLAYVGLTSHELRTIHLDCALYQGRTRAIRRAADRSKCEESRASAPAALTSALKRKLGIGRGWHA